MSNTILKTFAATAVVLALSSFAGTSAQEKKAVTKAPLKAPTCNSINTESPCAARTDCSWVAAVKDDKGKQMRRAYCRAKPAATPAKKDDKKKK